MTATDCFPPPGLQSAAEDRAADRPILSDESGHLAGRTLSTAEDSNSKSRDPLVDIAIPVYNEEGGLESSVRRLRTYLDQSFPFSASIVIVDNASTDSTWAIASRLSGEMVGVSALRLAQKGRGRAIRTAWTASRAEVVAYMDVDLSTDLDGLLPLVAPLLSGHSQVAIGSRIASGSRVLRGGKREFISRTYNFILHSTLRCRFSDAQCGFKAMRRDAVDALLSQIEDQAWFFDTELLIQAERNGLRIHEVSVDWIDDPDSRVRIVSTAREDLKGVWRLARQRPDFSVASHPETIDLNAPKSAFNYHGEMARYASVGLICTVAYVIAFLLLRDSIGIFFANIAAAAITATFNTIAHVAYTFRIRGAGQTRQAIAVGAFTLAVGIGVTTATLAVAYLIEPVSAAAQVVAIVAGMLAASCVRFVMLREWAFRHHTKLTRRRAGQVSSPGISAVAEAA
jgi:glycosyltransferase involved in cell wall biosynthesis